MWEKGSCLQDSSFCLENVYRDEKKLDEDSVTVPVQSRITAYWPDGTVKWTAHTADSALLADEIEVRAVAGGKDYYTCRGGRGGSGGRDRQPFKQVFLPGDGSADRCGAGAASGRT